MSAERNWQSAGAGNGAVAVEQPRIEPPGYHDFPKDEQIIEAMIEMGGDFVKSLGLMAKYADLDNIAKVKATWPEYWVDYTEHAKFNWRTLHDAG